MKFASTVLLWRQILFAAVLGAFLLVPVSVIHAQDATAAVPPTCEQETTKFVYDTTYGSYFGNRGAVASYNHLPICSGKAMAESFFVRLDSAYDWVETGIRQYDYDSSTTAHAWIEAGYFTGGSITVVENRNLDTCCVNGGAGVLTTGTDYVFELTNGSGTTWNVFIQHGSNPNTSGWKQIYATTSLVAYSGYIESESSRYGTSDAHHHAWSLQGQPNYNTGPWNGWSHLGCDYSQNSQTDWHAQKFSDQDWVNNAGAPTGGQC